ncbi:MAG: TenA family transcriptional regulator [Sulfurifustaceae bacterium]
MLHSNAGVDVDAVLVDCARIVQAKKNARHRFVTDVARERPSVAALGRWALQKYHQVYLQNRIFSIIHSKSDDEDVRQFMVEQLVAEETSITCGSDSHYNLMRRFAQACGVPPGQFNDVTIAPQVRVYVDTLLAIMREEPVAVALLAVYAIESQSGESVGKLLAALRADGRFTEAELEWFAVHANADDDHAEEGLRLVRKYAGEVPDFATRAPRTVERICDAWLVLHDFYHSLLAGSATQARTAPPHAAAVR